MWCSVVVRVPAGFEHEKVFDEHLRHFVAAMLCVLRSRDEEDKMYSRTKNDTHCIVPPHRLVLLCPFGRRHHELPLLFDHASCPELDREFRSLVFSFPLQSLCPFRPE